MGEGGDVGRGGLTLVALVRGVCGLSEGGILR
jgi:hypothetical protein